MRADEAELQKLTEEYSSVNTTAERKIEILKRKEQVHKKASDQVWDGINHNSEYDFRILLGEKFKRDKILKKHEKEWAKTPRLSIVLCEFIALPQKSKLNKDVIGEYLDALSGSKIKTYSSFKRPIPAFQQPFNSRSSLWISGLQIGTHWHMRSFTAMVMSIRPVIMAVTMMGRRNPS